MNRRNFLSASAALGLAAGASSAAAKAPNQYFLLREFQMRNSKRNQRERFVELLRKHALPASKRLGVVAGYFQVSLGENTPRMFLLSVYDSLADMEDKMAAAAADKEWMGAVKEYGSSDDALYDRQQSWLLKAFDGMPKIEVPKPAAKPRVYDLRRYEAETSYDLVEKMRMFNSGEIDVFRETGINPLLFGQTIVGSHMPNLTYLSYYDDMAAREKAWKAFLASDGWGKLKNTPGWSNAEIVATVSNTFLRPLPFSPIR